MLGRNQALNQVFITDRLDPKKIYAAEEARKEYKKMNERAINKKGWYSEEQNTIRIASLNVARLGPHIDDVRVDPTLLRADLIQLCETWIKPGDDTEGYIIPGFTARFFSVGEGKGIVIYTNNTLVYTQDIKREGYQATLYSSTHLDSIYIYRSANGNITDLKKDLTTIIDEDKATIISGDFNICLEKDPNNPISSYLRKKEFKQLVKDPSHIQGGLIDHVYIRDPQTTFQDPDLHRYSPYFTDHDCHCITFRKEKQVF